MSAPPSVGLEALSANEVRSAGSNAPLLLVDPDTAWRVVEGQLDVFVVPVANGAITGSREFLFQAAPGDVLFGTAIHSAESIALVAVGGADSAVAPLSLEDLRGFALEQPQLSASIIDRFVRSISSAFAVRGLPRIDTMAEIDGDIVLAPGTTIGSRRDVLWTQVQSGCVRALGEESLSLTADSHAFPLSPGGWLDCEEESGRALLRATTTEPLLTSGQVWEALAAFQDCVLAWASLVHARGDASRLSQLRSRIEADHGAHRDAISSMASVMTSGQQRADRKKGIPLLAAMEMVGAQLGIKFRSPGAQFVVTDPYGAARAIALASSVGQRRVMMPPGWWKQDVGPLLGFLEMRMVSMDGSSGGNDTELLPVALLPAGKGTYEIVNPETGSRSVITEQLAQHIGAFGVQFYRGLPNTKLRFKDLWRFAMFGLHQDARMILAMGVAGSVLGLVLPLLTAYLFDEVIPSADAPALTNVFIALVVATLAGAAFEQTSTMAVLRLRTRMGSALQMAVIDRLLRLPATFFRKYTVGDLGQRAFGINTIGNKLGTTTVAAALSGLVSVTSFVLLVYYSVPLALLALALLAVNITVSAVVARLIVVDMREYQEASGKLSGLVLQLLGGIAKLRVSATEARAFARWSAAFRRQQAVSFKVNIFSMNVDVFHTVLGIASTLTIYAFYSRMAATPTGGLSTGQFLAFSAAFGSFIAAGTSLSETAVTVLRLLPTWERARPLLDAEPEVDFFKPDPGELSGRIEVSQVSFSYTPDGPTVLHDVSLEAKPGEFIALVGPSGSGKSTLLRILLGFEKQRTGSVRFDGHDTTTVDINAVRRQIGVVLQNSSLSAGDIYHNIVGASALSVDEAWEAARMAGMEEDLQAMPMGMHTIVSEGGGALSGGQRQRLLIARALVTRPRILFFDEATSALDNRTQRIVSDSVDRLHATRVVLAHRLSTIRNADRIFVMEAGRLVESGTYDQLMERGGLFATMAARQQA